MLENVDKENFRGDGDRHFLAFPSHPLLLQYLSAKQTAWLHLQRVIFCLCHINRQHNPTPPPNPCTNPHNTAPPCFCLSAKHGDSSSDGRKKIFPTCIKCKCVCWRRGARAHTQADANTHTHTNTQHKPSSLSVGGTCHQQHKEHKCEEMQKQTLCTLQKRSCGSRSTLSQQAYV